MRKQYNSVREELNAASWRWYSLFLADVAVFNSESDLTTLQQSHCKEYPMGKSRICLVLIKRVCSAQYRSSAFS